METLRPIITIAYIALLAYLLYKAGYYRGKIKGIQECRDLIDDLSDNETETTQEAKED